jgi:hypothetical protein
MVFGSHIAGDGSRTSEKEYFLSKFNSPKGFCKRPLLNNGNSSFKCKLWNLHNFHDLLPAQEDIEFSMWHMKENHAKLYFEPDAKVIHYHNDSNWSLYNRLYKEYAVEFYLGKESIDSCINFIFSVPLLIIKDLIAAKKSSLVLKATLGILTFRFTQTISIFHALVTYNKFMNGIIIK